MKPAQIYCFWIILFYCGSLCRETSHLRRGQNSCSITTDNSATGLPPPQNLELVQPELFFPRRERKPIAGPISMETKDLDLFVGFKG